MNAADTFVDIRCSDRKKTTFVSESGVMEFFLLGGRDPERLSKKLGNLTGFPALHPLFALGFHYS